MKFALRKEGVRCFAGISWENFGLALAGSPELAVFSFRDAETWRLVTCDFSLVLLVTSLALSLVTSLGSTVASEFCWCARFNTSQKNAENPS